MDTDSGRTVIFVCTSNTCRSPMAEAFGKSWLLQNYPDKVPYDVVSRSLTEDYEPVGSPASRNGIEVLAQYYSLNTEEHRSCLLTSSDVESAIAIVGVSRSHVQTIRHLFPEAARKTFALSRDIPDPWHEELDVYHQCARLMKPLVEEAMAKIASVDLS